MVGGPDSKDDEEDEAGEIDRAASAQAGVAADEDHGRVHEPHGEGEQDLGVEEEGWPDSLLRDERADEETHRHTGEAVEEGLQGDLVSGVERREPAQGGSFGFETALLDQVQQRRQQAEKQGGVGG